MHQRQVSRVNNKCGLERVGSLDFDFYYGTCTSVNNSELVVLCFADPTACHVATDPEGTFDAVTPSSFPHKRTRIASINGKF